jgi:hypothetical protein
MSETHLFSRHEQGACNGSADTVWRLVALTLFLLLCIGYYFLPLWDSDFWWHIAAGREIFASGKIPSHDPFGVYPAADVIRNDTVLKGQWLGQVVLYALFKLGGVDAVVAFRALVLVSCVALVYLRCRWRSAQGLVLWAVLTLVALVAHEFSGERPQLLSFLFAALFFVVLERAEQHDDVRWLILLPLITLLWANSHGGVLLGVALMAIWGALKFFDSQAPLRERQWWLLAIVGVFIASLLTPNGILTYRYLFALEGSVLQARTSEYISALQIYTLGHVWPQVWIYIYYLLAMVAMYGLWHARQWRPLVLTVFLVAISIASFRYFIFFMIVAGPFVATGVTRVMSSRLGLTASLGRLGQIASILVLLIVISLGTLRGSLFQGGLYTPAYPVAIASFVEGFAQQQGLRGRVFNNLEWGGYLLWRLPRELTLYIDGRMLDEARFPPYTHILWATPQGVQWFERAHFQLVILPHHGRFDPRRYRLIDYLRTRPDWLQVYQDAKGVVFVRR